MERPALLEDRQKTHGDFATNAAFSQAIKQLMNAPVRVGATCYGPAKLGNVHREALDMIALKLSRILSGQADFKDHWDDLAGYAQLGAEACPPKKP